MDQFENILAIIAVFAIITVGVLALALLHRARRFHMLIDEQDRIERQVSEMRTRAERSREVSDLSTNTLFDLYVYFEHIAFKTKDPSAHKATVGILASIFGISLRRRMSFQEILSFLETRYSYYRGYTMPKDFLRLTLQDAVGRNSFLIGIEHNVSHASVTKELEAEITAWLRMNPKPAVATQG